MKSVTKAFIIASLALAGCGVSATAGGPPFAQVVGLVPKGVSTFSVDGVKCIAIVSGNDYSWGAAALSCNWEKK